jgi:hypothetical protein
MARCLRNERGGHSSSAAVTGRLKQPTRTTGPESPGLPCERPRYPYSVLLPVGLAMPSALPRPRCALTAPFHPDLVYPRMHKAVCFLWRYPLGHPSRALPGTVSPWSPDFPPRSCNRGGRPANWHSAHVDPKPRLVKDPRNRSRTYRARSRIET